MSQANPVTLGLTTDPAFSGLGWCYFAADSYVSVTIALGIQGVGGSGGTLSTTHPLFTSNASLAIGTSTAQAHVGELGSAPLWLGGNWQTFLIAVNPVVDPVIGDLNITVYGDSGSELGFAAPALGSRQLRVVTLSSFETRVLALLRTHS